MSISERTDASSCIIQDLDILLASVRIVVHNWITESVCMPSAKVAYSQSESLLWHFLAFDKVETPIICPTIEIQSNASAKKYGKCPMGT